MGATQVLGGFGIIYGPDGVTALSIVGNAPPTVSSGDGTNAPSALTITGAPGGVASSTSAPQGGLGGGFGVNAGAGGAVTGASGASQGGGGGLQTWAAGNGGDSASTSGTGGIGGVGSFVAGNGGSATAVSGTTHGGQGGNALVGAGNGGVVQSASGVRGSGGHTRVVPGKAATGTGTGGADGHIAMCHDGTSAIGNMGVRNDAPDSAYAIDVTGRVRASGGYSGLLLADLPGWRRAAICGGASVQTIPNSTETPLVLGTSYDQDSVGGQAFQTTGNLTGTVSKSTSSTTLTGSSTLFTTEAQVGQVLKVPGSFDEWRTVTAITDNTHLTVDSLFFANASGQTASHDPSFLVCRLAGLYLLDFYVPWAVNATGQRISYLYVNEGNAVPSQDIQPGLSGVLVANVKTAGPYFLNQWERLRATVIQTSGGNLNTVANNAANSPRIAMTYYGQKA